MKLDPNVYREAAAYLSIARHEAGADGMCTALAWYFQGFDFTDLYNYQPPLKGWFELRKTYAAALADVFDANPNKAYWWTDNEDATETSQCERFMAMHFMAEMLENPCYD